jgi:H+/Cl- antiporter ClcA
MSRILRVIFWGGTTLALSAALVGILYLWISSMYSTTPQGDVFPLLMAGSLLGLFIPKARKRFTAALK